MDDSIADANHSSSSSSFLDCWTPLFPCLFPFFGKMGSGSSSEAVSKSQRDEDLHFLAERFPYGDTELGKLYDAYQKIHGNDKNAFLRDWATAMMATSSSSSSSSASWSNAWSTIVGQILPPDFGRRLYQGSFAAQGENTANSISSPDGGGGGSSNNSSAMMMDNYTRQARLEAFFTGLAQSSRRGTAAAVTVLVQTCNTRQGRIKSLEFVDMCYRLALAVGYLQALQAQENGAAADSDVPAPASYVPSPSGIHDEDNALQALADAIVQQAKDRRQNDVTLQRAKNDGTGDEDDNGEELLKQGWVQLDDVQAWAQDVPVLGAILPTLWYYVLFPGQPFPPSRTAFSFPIIPEESVFFPRANAPKLFVLGCLSTQLGGGYYRLYTSAADGLSFNRLSNALLGYSGPTLLLVRAIGGGVFGAFTSHRWKESGSFYGTSDCFLLQMAPTTAVYRPKGNQKNYMYCNPTSRSKGYDQQAHGIGFGGDTSQPRLFLEESFDDNYAGYQDLTFDNGALLPKTSSGTHQTYFTIDSLEVWGVGGADVVEQALGARTQARAHRDEGIQRARKVDKAQFLDDFRNGFFGNKNFQHREQVDGRAKQDLSERKDRKYEYE